MIKHSINLYLKDKNLDRPTSIYMSVHYRGERMRVSTGIQIQPELWDSMKQDVKTHTKAMLKKYRTDPTFKSKLSLTRDQVQSCKRRADDYFLEIAQKNLPFSRDALKKYTLTHICTDDGAPDDTTGELLPYLEDFIDKRDRDIIRKLNGESYSKGTLKNYRNLRTTLIAYDKEEGKKTRWDSINRNWYNRFISWHQRQNLSSNYTGRHIKDIKSLMRSAHEDGVHENVSYNARWFATPRARAIKIPLDEGDLQKLYLLPLEENSEACRARDMFLLACYTGLRRSDIKRLTPEHIKEVDGRMRIELTTQKDKDALIIPASTRAYEILERNAFRCPKIHPNRANELIKEIALRCGISEHKQRKLSLHVGRHTFATLAYYHYKLPIGHIMTITGHSKESTLRKYLNADKEEIAAHLGQHAMFQ